MTAPTVDTPADDERTKAFTVDDREACMLYAAESSPELPHVKLWYAFVAQHAALLAARREVETLRTALEEVEESLNHPDLADADERCDEIALTVAAALAATPEEK